MSAKGTTPKLLSRRFPLTPAQVLGPYFIANAKLQSSLFPQGTSGEEMQIAGQVLAQDGTLIADATVSIWVADPTGRYDNQKDDGSTKPIAVKDHKYRGRIIADKSGSYAFNMLRPGNYFDGGWNLWRPAHIHVRVEAKGYKTLTTQLYFEDDAHNTLDIPGDDFFQPELVVRFNPAGAASGVVQKGVFNFVLTK
jgi:catechol 1,2-dioxygenase